MGLFVMAGPQPLHPRERPLAAFAWIPGTKGDLGSPSMEDAKAKPWLWPGMTVVAANS
jgi:hypothetical protein